jgi:hypothetical protein
MSETEINENVENETANIAEDVVEPSAVEQEKPAVAEEIAEAAETPEEISHEVVSNMGTTTEDVVASAEPVRTPRPRPSVKEVNNTIGSATAKDKDTTAKKAPTTEKVAVFSEKNVSWSGVGTLYRGYNFVTKPAADKWVTKSFVRLATPEEIAREFGK